MNLAELKEAYKARKLALDSAKKEEEKYKALLKDAMLEAGESDYTDEAGYRFERIVQERKSMDEEKLFPPTCSLSFLLHLQSTLQFHLLPEDCYQSACHGYDGHHGCFLSVPGDVYGTSYPFL